MCRTLFDRDTAPGAEPEDLLRLDIPALIVPGRDAAHATSAARYLEECLPRADYWDVPVEGQTRTRPTRGYWSFWPRLTLERPGGMVDYYSILSRAMSSPEAGDPRGATASTSARGKCW